MVLEILAMLGKGLGYILLYLGFFTGLVLHVFGLPGNWLIFILLVIYSFVTSFQVIGWWTLGIFLGLAIIGEIIEFLMGMWGAGKYGASRKGQIASLAGGLLGGIIGAGIGMGFFSIITSIIGVFAGTFGGAFLVEYLNEKGTEKSMKIGMGAVMGRVAGMMGKLAIGFTLVIWATVSMIR